MKRILRNTFGHRAIAPFCLLALCLLAAPAAPARQKMSAEEVIAKHLESVGATESRKAVESLMATGEALVTFRAPGKGQVGGRAVVASQGESYAVAMAFDESPNYPQEKFGFDGKEVTVSYVRPGQRSALGDFLATNKEVVRYGIMGGALTDAWTFFSPEKMNAKLEYGGTDKVGDRRVHKIKFMPRGGTDLRITLFFDAENFQHLRTEYTRVIAAQIGTNIDNSAQQSETRYKMTEDFSDFRKEGGLTLPHAYKIRLEIRSQRGNFDGDWQIGLAQFNYNQRIAPAAFDVDGN
jgi:hypothetical protein